MLFKDILSQDCNNLCLQLCTTNKYNLEILKSKMRRRLPLQCIEDGRKLRPTHNIFKDFQMSLEENLMVAIHEIFQQMIQIFNQNLGETARDENSMAVFQAGLHQKIQHLETCLSAEMENGIPSSRGLNMQLIRLRVKRYFRRINDLLRMNQHSLCLF
ncbi:interferon omega-1-like [Eublepharis macularius]|uniref:Interferon omega-1-like n=1 Tax=Eublepharis macularius TaxID=481883 RepID=A0AA97JVF6_EUBMA|nr:interferon omega-1-like [Eublepharis macularius]